MTKPDLNPSLSQTETAVGTDDRRTEPRFPASGEVRLLLNNPQSLSIPGRILDVSQHGMRVEHMYAALTSGTILQIESGGT